MKAIRREFIHTCFSVVFLDFLSAGNSLKLVSREGLRLQAKCDLLSEPHHYESGRCLVSTNTTNAQVTDDRYCNHFEGGHQTIVHSAKAFKITGAFGTANGYSAATNFWIGTWREDDANMSDDGWYYYFDGQAYGPMPTKAQGWLDKWIAWSPNGWNTDRCLVFYYWDADGYGYEETRCTDLLEHICEYRTSARQYEPVNELIGQRASDVAVFWNATVSRTLDCLVKCQANWVCASVAFNAASGDCQLQMVTKEDANITRISAPGYVWMEDVTQ